MRDPGSSRTRIPHTHFEIRRTKYFPAIIPVTILPGIPLVLTALLSFLPCLLYHHILQVLCRQPRLIILLRQQKQLTQRIPRHTDRHMVLRSAAKPRHNQPLGILLPRSTVCAKEEIILSTCYKLCRS